MSGRAVGLIVFLVLVAVIAGHYASAPKYVLYCAQRAGSADARAEPAIYDPRLIPLVPPKPGTCLATRVRRAAAWERVWYAIVGSKKTRD